nr:MAG TPA: hypothetical protein [Caudoviricetes sp.]
MLSAKLIVFPPLYKNERAGCSTRPCWRLFLVCFLGFNQL